MQRCCFTLQIKKDRISEYLAAHEVWPEMLQAISDAGFQNYSLFLSEDGLAVGYFETDNLEETLAKLGDTEVNRKWQEHMAEYFDTGGDLKTGGIEWLKQYFYSA